MSNIEGLKKKGTDHADSLAELGHVAHGEHINTNVSAVMKGIIDHAAGRAGVPLPAGYEKGDPVAMGRLGSDQHGFWTCDNQVEILSSGEMFREPGIAKLGNHDYWTTYCQRSAGTADGKFNAKIIGQILMERSRRAGEIHVRNVPATVAPPEVVQHQLLLAQMRAMPNPDTLASFLKMEPEWPGNVWRNEFAGRIEVTLSPPSGGKPGPWTDRHTKLLAAWLSSRHKINATPAIALQAIDLLGLADERHPVRDYLNGLKWDDVPRLDTWLTTFAGVEINNKYTRAVGSKTLIGLVARIMVPGCKFDTALIFEGIQGGKKSTLIQKLLPNKEWYSNTLHSDLESKDAAIGTYGKWLLELAEGRFVSKNAVEVVKNFLSTDTDNYRPPYGTLPEDHPRQCGFMGSINPEADGRYLRDTTGGRRFWPVKVARKADIPALIEVRDQLWAESVARFKGGEEWWLDDATEKLAENEQADRLEDNVWEEHLETFTRRGPVPGDKNGTGWIDRVTPLTRATAAEVFEAIMGRKPTNKDQADQKCISAAFKAAGWRYVNRSGRGWVRDPPAKDKDPGEPF